LSFVKTPQTLED